MDQHARRDHPRMRMAVKETVSVRLIDTPTLQRLFRQPPGSVGLVRATADDHVENRSILDAYAPGLSAHHYQYLSASA